MDDDDREDFGERWDRIDVGGSEYMEFDRVQNKRSQRPDLHAFLLLDEMFPRSSDIIACACHDEFYLDVGGDEVESLTDEQILELIRCGVMHRDGSLFMFA